MQNPVSDVLVECGGRNRGAEGAGGRPAKGTVLESKKGGLGTGPAGSVEEERKGEMDHSNFA